MPCVAIAIVIAKGIAGHGRAGVAGQGSAMSRLRQAQESPPMSPSHQQQRNGSRSQRSIMDLRNLCQRLDVDSLKGMFAIGVYPN